MIKIKVVAEINRNTMKSMKSFFVFSQMLVIKRLWLPLTLTALIGEAMRWWDILHQCLTKDADGGLIGMAVEEMTMPLIQCLSAIEIVVSN